MRRIIYLSSTVVSILGVLVICTIPFVLRPFIVDGSSMSPSLETGELFVVDTLSLHIIPQKRGEIIVLRNPHKKNTTGEVDIKRVVGLPGETVHVRKDRVVVDRACDPLGVATTPQYVDVQPEGSPCQITYMQGTLLGGLGMGNTNEFDMFLGSQDFFVLGDDRRVSSDSRIFGAVQEEDLVGRAAVRLLPISRIGVLYEH